MCSELVMSHVINHDALHKLSFYVKSIGIGNGIRDTGPVFTWYQYRHLQYRIPPVHLQSHPLCFLFTTTHLHCPSTKQAHACRQPRRPQWTAWRTKALLPGSQIGLALTRKFQFRSVQLFKTEKGLNTLLLLSQHQTRLRTARWVLRWVHISPVFLVTIQKKLRSLFYNFMFPLQSISKKNNRI